MSLPVAWEERYPAMSQGLRALDFDAIDKAEEDPFSLGTEPLCNIPEPFFSIEKTGGALSNWEQLSTNGVAFLAQKAPRRIPNKKWQQVDLFAHMVLSNCSSDVSQWLDWCSGKGHLGRTLCSRSHRKGVCVEINAALCAAGQREAEQEDVPVTWICRDVRDGAVELETTNGVGAVALHACGQLHRLLIEQAVQQQLPFVAVAPCCYHRIAGERYAPLSEAGNGIGLTLCRHHLSLITLEENIASAKARAQRRREQHWRLALDLMRRKTEAKDTYVSVDSVPADWLNGSFGEFCEKVSKRDRISLPGSFCVNSVLEEGLERLRVVRALGLLRGLFRRSLESWIVLDRALYLEESGYRVQVGEFCHRDLTPRNLMIIAAK